MKSQFPAAPELEPSYDWKIFGHDGPLFDPAKSLPAGKLVQELLFHLLSDFYRPITLASLATRLFPGEFYNPTYTPNRVHQLVKRLRTWIAEHAPGLIIEENQGSYRLSAEAPIVIRTGPSGSADSIEGLLASLSQREFTTKEFAAMGGFSLSKATRLLNAACANGQVTREGKGARTRFKMHAPWKAA